MRYRVPAAVIETTFQRFRACGGGQRECQALWVSPWADPDGITETVHPKHRAHFAGFQVDDAWLTAFWLRLSDEALGIRVQVHTHPGRAYHSGTDNDFPVLRDPGFLSLVIPDFGTRGAGFERAFLAQVQPDRTWREVPIADHLEIA